MRLFALLFFAALAAHANSAFEGRWRLDLARSTALDGWSTADLMIGVEGGKISLRHDMTWHRSKVTATNRLDTALTTGADVADFFRIDQRHMAVFVPPGRPSHVKAAWLDGGRTLRVEALVPLEISQGEATMRIYSEYRVLENGASLVLIELHDSRSRPLVYHFTKVPETAAKK